MEKQRCGNCEKEFEKYDLTWVKDRYGIPYKKVCRNCYDEVEMAIRGWVFDESYAGERLEDDY